MNQRIKELAEQAETKEIGYYFFDKEKFAELIVKECAEVSINNGCGDFVDIEQKLFEHFGVEE
jgi:UDP-N-acetylmuramyl tripeptide synthase